MSFLRAGGDGVYNIPALNASGQLYIRGKKFEDYINELVFEDSFEQAEITELKLLLQYLNTTGLSSEWIIDNNNKNQDLKTLITALQTAVDAVDGKIRYVSSVQGSNTAPKTPSTFNVSIGDREKRQLYLTSGANFISSTNDSTNQAAAANYADNQINIVAQNGMVTSLAHLNRIEGIDKIELTGFGGMGIQSSPNIIIGNKGAQIRIGSEDTPEVGSTNTIITIGKRSVTKNTETQLRGNIKIVDARFDELSTSPALTWTNLIGLIPTSGLPLWVASAILTSVIPNYVYSDLWAMKGTVTKDGDVETITTPKMKGYTVYDSTIDVSILPKVQTFLAKGDISETTLLGNIRQQVFNGEILLRNNNILATNIDWAITDAMDKVNALKLSNNDVEIIAGGGANNSQLRISNTTTGGKIRIRVGSGGLQANAHDALAIYNDQTSSQVLIAGSNVPSGYDTSSKLLVDHQNLTHGIKVTKNTEALVTRVNHNNINTPSLTLQSNWTGAIANTLYLNASNQLMYNGSAVGAGAGGGTSTGGIIFLLRGPATNDMFAGAPPLLTASDTYTGLAQKSFRLQMYNAGQTYHLFTHRGAINKITNPVIKGIWEYVINVAYSSNQAGSIYTDAYFTASETDSPSGSFMLKAYAGADQAGTGFISPGSSTFTAYWFINSYQYQFSFTSVIFSLVTFRGSNCVFRCVLEDNAGTVLYTFPDITRTSTGSGTSITVESLTFTAPSLQTLTHGFLSTATRMRWKFTLVSGTSVGGFSVYYNQSNAASPTNMAFQVPTGSYTTPLSLNINNQKALQFDTTAIKEYELSVPIMEFDLTLFDAPKFDLRFNFIQPSGSTTNHFLQAYFNDGSLSHCHTALNITSQVPRLDEVMARSASTPTSMYFYNGAGIQNVASISDTSGYTYNVKNIVAGVPANGLSVANNGGIVTVSLAASAISGFKPYFYYATMPINVNLTPGFINLPNDTNLIDYDYYITFEINKVYFGKFLYLSFNGSTNHAYNYEAMYYSNQANIDLTSPTYGETNGGAYGRVYQASDNGVMPIFFSPGGGSFYYASLTLVYKMSAVSQSVTTLELMNHPMYRAAGTTKENGGGGTNDSLGDGIGCDYHSIRGRINYMCHRMYLPNNNGSWSPTSIGVSISNNDFIQPMSVKMQINRIAKNTSVL